MVGHKLGGILSYSELSCGMLPTRKRRKGRSRWKQNYDISELRRARRVWLSTWSEVSLLPKLSSILTFTRRAASEPVRKLIESALANAEAQDANVDNLYVKTLFVDEESYDASVSTTCNGSSYTNQ